MNVDNTEEFRCISLCTGYAGIELGLRRVIPNMRTVAYVEIEAFAAANLVAKIEGSSLDVAPVWTDIKTFDGQVFHNRIHIITGGYPCQPFSVAGKRKGTDDPRHLWPYIERIVSAVKPVWCFFENVPGHLTIGFPDVYRSLRNMGYKVEAGLFTAAECGAPHRRKRLFILANDWNRMCGTQSRKAQRRKFDIIGSSEKLAYRECAESGMRIGQKSQAGIRRDRPAIGSENMADTTAQRIQGTESAGPASTGRSADEQGYTARWPARPGQPQYEWEEPRTLADNKKKINRRLQRKTKNGHESEFGGSIESKQSKGQAQSGLGRAVNGTASRMDRLRLLGNGVVPQQAELAFRTLIKLFNNQS